VFYSTGRGFIASQKQLEQPTERDLVDHTPRAPLDFALDEDLLSRCFANQLAIHEVVLVNEDALRPRGETIAQLDRISGAMLSCIDRGLISEGILLGGLNVKRRAPALWRKLKTELSNEPETVRLEVQQHQTAGSADTLPRVGSGLSSSPAAHHDPLRDPSTRHTIR
jgi:L-serine dehydratase